MALIRETIIDKPLNNDAMFQPGANVSHAMGGGGGGGEHTTGPGASALASILRNDASSGEPGLFIIVSLNNLESINCRPPSGLHLFTMLLVDVAGKFVHGAVRWKGSGASQAAATRNFWIISLFPPPTHTCLEVTMQYRLIRMAMPEAIVCRKKSLRKCGQVRCLSFTVRYHHPPRLRLSTIQSIDLSIDLYTFVERNKKISSVVLKLNFCVCCKNV